MSDKKTKECIVCGGKGYHVKDLLSAPPCEECNGLGVVPVKETRKSILVPPRLHRRLMDISLQLDQKMVEFMHTVADDYEKQLQHDE